MRSSDDAASLLRCAEDPAFLPSFLPESYRRVQVYVSLSTLASALEHRSHAVPSLLQLPLLQCKGLLEMMLLERER